MIKNQYGKIKKLIYLASPYTLDGGTNKLLDMEIRFQQVCYVEAKLKEKYLKTHIFFGPIGSSHWIAKYMKPELHTYETWIDETDNYWLTLCDEVWVVCLDQWDKSKGVQYEINFAKRSNKPIKYINPITGEFKHE